MRFKTQGGKPCVQKLYTFKSYNAEALCKSGKSLENPCSTIAGEYEEKRRKGPAAPIPVPDVRLDATAHWMIMAEKKWRCKEMPYFEVGAVRVFCLWDPPHLIKNKCNNWGSKACASPTVCFHESKVCYSGPEPLRCCGYKDFGTDKAAHRSARGGSCDSPDSVQFECEYQAVATGLMFNNSEKTNCEQELDTFLLLFSTYTSQKSPQNSDAVLESDVNIPEGVLPKHVLDLLSEMRPPVSAAVAFDNDGSVLVYTAGYMASKVVGKFADSEDGEKGLKVPSMALVDLVKALESNFQKKISSVIHSWAE
ncbi:unnamed protein product [Leuciscus chuanchicus]